MGAGASRNHHSIGIPSPPRESLSPVKDTVQPKIPVQDQHFSHEAQNKDIKEQVDVARTSQTIADKKASPNDTLETYIVKHPDQAEDLETMLERLQALKNFVAKNLNDPDDYATLGKQTIEGLFETSVHTFESAGTQEEKEFITLIEFTIDVGGAEQLKRFVQHCFKKFSYLINEESDDEEETDDYTCYNCLFFSLAAIQNFSDFHQGFCSACAGAGIISMCFEIVKQIDAENSNWEEEDEDSELVTIIDGSIGILHNISRRLRDRELFANREQTLLYFAKKEVPATAESLLTLAYLVDENTNHLILADENLLSFIITLLDEAWQSEDRHSNGYSAKELAEGLSHLAINDANKNILGQNGVIPVLISVIKTSNEDEEKASATRALWMLAFDDNNKEKVRQEEGAMDILHQLQQSKNSEVQKAAAGALWELEGKTARQSSEKIESTGNHVMISYQWDSQEVLVEVKNRLQASGYRVWMDLEQMGGSTLEAMAKAVEDSSVVLICVSERYKESPNCRSEAEYAYQLRKDIIPLMMQGKYRGDGWLGMLVGTKLWFDFQNKLVLEQGVTKLIRELGGRGKELDVTDGPSEPAVRAVQADLLAPPSSPGVSTWTNKDVKQWFKEIGLEKVCKEDISEMNGQTLIDLQELRGECPDYFYRCIERTLKLTDMFDLLKFRKELSKLV